MSERLEGKEALKEALTQSEGNEDWLSVDVEKVISEMRDWVDFLTLIYNNLRKFFPDEDDFKDAINMIKSFKNNENTSKGKFLEFIKDLASADDILEIWKVFKRHRIEIYN